MKDGRRRQGREHSEHRDMSCSVPDWFVRSFSRHVFRVPSRPGLLLGGEDVAVNRADRIPAFVEPAC